MSPVSVKVPAAIPQKKMVDRLLAAADLHRHC
jgi:hypothetical protein